MADAAWRRSASSIALVAAVICRVALSQQPPAVPMPPGPAPPGPVAPAAPAPPGPAAPGPVAPAAPGPAAPGPAAPAPPGPQIRQITPPTLHGEGPHWDCGQNMLFYVDISGQKMHRYDPATEDLKTVLFDGPVSPVVPVLGTLDQLAVGVGTDLVLVTVDWGRPGAEPRVNQTVTLLASVDRDKPDNRFNDGKADRRGRLWIGTMGPEPVVGQVMLGRGSLYRFEADNSSVRGSERMQVQKVLSPVDISNGLAWNDIETLMYYIDTPSGRIDVFDFDVDRGAISNGRPAFDLRANNITGHPDGMTMDVDGNLWVACFDGGQVIKVDPVAGRLLQTVPIPASRVTSVVFGGRDLSTLYVTTMSKGLTPKQQRAQPAAGAVFAVTGLGTSGQRPGSRKTVVRDLLRPGGQMTAVRNK